MKRTSGSPSKKSTLAAQEPTVVRQDHVVLIPNFFDELRRIAP
jgi:hypothetical protein